MAKKKTQIPTEFEDLLSVYGSPENREEVTNMNDIDSFSNPIVDDDIEVTKPVEDITEDNKSQNVDTIAREDDTDIPQEVLNDINKDDNINTNNDNTNDIDESVDDVKQEQLIEAQQVGALFDAVGESLGWNMSDIDDEERPLTVEDLTNYLKEVVNLNSVPQYADERVQQLDEYIKNGGNFEDFYTRQQQAISFDSLDMEDEINQKTVIRELLKHYGYTDKQIESKISRYEDADVLEEESEDALIRLKQIRQVEIENQRRQQEEYAKQQEEQSRAFFNSVTNDINNLSDIRGISIPKEDRRALFDYIFKTDENGLSQYQKDFNKNLSKNLIESAYFTMKADALISNAKKSGETSAADKLRQMLRHSSKNHSTYTSKNKQKSVIELASKFF